MAKQKTAFQFAPDAASVQAAIASGDVSVRSTKESGEPITVKAGDSEVPVTRYVAVNAKGALALIGSKDANLVAAINRFVAYSQDVAIRSGAEKPLEARMLVSARRFLEQVYKLVGVEFDPKGNEAHKAELEAKAAEFANIARNAATDATTPN